MGILWAIKYLTKKKLAKFSHRQGEASLRGPVGENASSSLAFQASGPRSVFESIGMLG